MRALLLFLPLLAACQMQSPEFSGVTPMVTQQDRDKILVFRKGNRAQAIRTNRQPKSARGVAVDNLIMAIQTTTGCTPKPRSIKGDTVLISVTLTCE